VTDLAFSYPVEIVAFVVSRGHNYYFHGPVSGGMGPHPTHYPTTVELVAGKGIVGDRFFGRASRMKAAVSFVAAEALEAVTAELGLASPLDPRLMRRNLVVRGMDLNALRLGDFALEQDGGAVRFSGSRETAPCEWMDAVLAAGARDALRGRGGLRATPLDDGRLSVGPAVLHAAVPVDAARAGLALRRRSQLP
jgi:MOSC domain